MELFHPQVERGIHPRMDRIRIKKIRIKKRMFPLESKAELSVGLVPTMSLESSNDSARGAGKPLT